ncbi:MAG: MEKHLA domain-containing protein [Mariprofundaceae bacterium]|nr:MEKHLA domain-containing protein [Mariprofundaceae bacterium]
MIGNATIWNLLDDRGGYRGQAAMFSDWKYL